MFFILLFLNISGSRVSLLVGISMFLVLVMCFVILDEISIWCWCDIRRFCFGKLLFKVFVIMWIGCRYGVFVRFFCVSLCL